MGETITMADVLYVPVDNQGEPPRASRPGFSGTRRMGVG